MSPKRAGFTLIELLVVVLIIGILSAVALPQYQTVVLKSRLSTVMSNVKSITTALELYFLNNGVYPVDDVTALDVEIAGCETSGGTMTCKKEAYDYWINAPDTPTGGFPLGQGIAYIQYPSLGMPIAKRGTQECWAEIGNTAANRACASMGGVELSTSNWRASPGKSWQTYTLP